MMILVLYGEIRVSRLVIPGIETVGRTVGLRSETIRFGMYGTCRYVRLSVRMVLNRVEWTLTDLNQ